MKLNTAIFVTVAFLAVFSQAQRTPHRSNLLIEVTQTNSGIGNFKTHHLWARLTDDGVLEWEAPAGPLSVEGNKFHSSHIDPKRTSVIERDLESVDWTMFTGKLGPYYRYVDSGVEMHFRIVDTAGEHNFTVINPWPYRISLKPMPTTLKRTICELQILRAQASGEKVFPSCEDTVRTLQCAEGSKPCVKP